jgi:signal peptidase I
MMNKRTDEKTGMKSYVLYLIPAFVIIVILVLFRTVLLLGYVPSESMEPTLERDSYIIGTRLYRDIDIGDIIIFEREGTMMVKRVAACAGDMVMVNG